ncbi:TetR family transcriptional regulator [Mycolicibacterium duvalii]|nr:TetR family transcriptional regulator [Mycolicibacterium duvalii]
MTAARRLLVTDGYDKLSMESLARAANTSRPTVYRRWPSKVHVVFDAAFGDAAAGAEVVGSGDFAQDVRGFTERVIRFWTDPVVEAAVMGILTERHRDPDLSIRAQQLLDDSTRAQFRALVDAGIAAGTARPDVDGDALYDVLIGSTFYGVQVLGHRADDDFVDRICSVVLQGAAPRVEEDV